MMKKKVITVCCLMMVAAMVLPMPVLAEEYDEEEFIGEQEIDSEFEAVELVERPDDIDEEEFTGFSLFDRTVFLGGELQFSS